MRSWLRDVLTRRPWWMNGLLGFCAYMTFVYMPFDFFLKPVSADVEVWFGVMLRGYAAKATEPLHWAIYAAGVYGFWHMRPWLWPWAGLYVAQIAIGALVWSIGHFGGAEGVVKGVVSALPLGWLAVLLLRARDRFQAPRESLRARYGEWALVTGASSGIGAAFARALAREGFSLVLSARRHEMLDALATEITAEHAVETRVVALDLAAVDGAERLVEAVADLEIGMLVNNAGFGRIGRFDGQDDARLTAMLQVHCNAPLVLTHRLLAGMRARGRGAVLFTGSLAAKQPMPLHATYAASKAFVSLFGEALWAELRGTGIDVLVVEPGTTETAFQAIAGEIEHAGAKPEAVVDLALERLGRQPSVGVGWWRWLRGNLAMRLLPRSLLACIAHDFVAKQTPPSLR